MFRVGRTRVDLEQCRKMSNKVERMLFSLAVDLILTEKDLEEKLIRERLRGDKRKLDRKKFPDCAWHLKKCTYKVLEIKSSSLKKAIRQLENFTRNFPEIHANVELYIIVLENRRDLRKLKVKCDPKSWQGNLCRPMRLVGRRWIPMDIRGKPLYFYFER